MLASFCRPPESVITFWVFFDEPLELNVPLRGDQLYLFGYIHAVLVDDISRSRLDRKHHTLFKITEGIE